MSFLGVLSDVAGMLEPAADAWRYIFSPKFRAAKHEAWRNEHVTYVIWDILWGVLALSAAIGVLIVVGMVAWRYT